jgi:crotonobetainyl-CoA:carnitine CoA-transferase CaiB-like acyl-CoA transferase
MAGRDIEVFGSPLKLSETPPPERGEAPQLGQHNREVYVSWLGLSEDRFAALCDRGVI